MKWKSSQNRCLLAVVYEIQQVILQENFQVVKWNKKLKDTQTTKLQKSLVHKNCRIVAVNHTHTWSNAVV